MSLYKFFELGCDGDGCYNAYAARVAETSSALRMRRGAQAAGWRHRNGRDYCPACVAATTTAGKEQR
ncbi:MAG TPA: hypothetical protein VHA75_18290 [Rugosimonospora sp.]|nr:hypothetical protein [Rugosimonospora sp.]